VRRVAAAFAFFAALLGARAALSDETSLHRLVSILDYVAADYGGAVQDGKVTSQFEYEEQLAFLDSALEIAPAHERPAVESLKALVVKLAPASEVAAAARALRDGVVRAHGLQLSPTRRPQRERGAALFTQSCAVCHGEDGRAETARAKELQPPPASFHDAERGPQLSPYKVFNAETFGREGTGMASFAEALSEGGRWDIAFHVLALRHRGAPEQAPAPRPSLRKLATSTDAELSAAGATPAEIAWMRLRGPYEEDRSPFDTARALVDEALRANDRAGAQGLALDAYLRGFEPAEGRVRAQNAALAQRIERAFLDLRVALGTGDASRAAAVGRDLRVLLDRAEDETAAAGSSPGALALAAFVIVLREGVEAVLLLAAILAALRRFREDTGGLARYVHAGWIAALAAGVVTWAAATALIGLFPNREAAEGWTSLAAAAVLLYTGFWLVSQSESRRWLSFLRASVRPSAAALFLVAFLAVYREAAETVLFFQSLLLDAEGRAGAVLAGAGAGALALTGVFALVFGLGRRVPQGPFFGATGALMYLLAVVFAGKGVHALQIAGTLRPYPLALPDLPWLGFYGDTLGITVQAALVAVFVIAAVSSWSGRLAAVPSPTKENTG
jgi:high-affinity iron transporter